MKQLDVYYRALLEYREQTQQNRECISDSGAVVKANADLDKIVLTRKHCIIEEDWVETIEEGLKYIGKAIAEERQFIYSNGETVPIEKVKTVSKDSVVHLAKHSNLITREIPGEDIIPDQLYTVEKLNDYTVYENKFLYMLLCYLRDFITIRYNKILELSNTYNGTMTMNKVVKTAKRTMQYRVDFAEEKKDDEYLKETNRAKDIINRIDLLLKTVLSFFATPLMQVVSKAPMIKPPITRTNVLKMNNNFKQALNLYGYVVAYESDGYRVETEVKELSPFNDAIGAEMAETILLSSFITYEHSLGIEADLKQRYDLEQKRRKERALEEFREKLEAARLRVQKSEMSMEEYILMLEKYIRTLEKKAKELDEVKQELQQTKELLEQTTKENEELKCNLERTIQELEAEKLRYITDMEALKLAHEEEMKNLAAEYEEKIAEIIENHNNEIVELKEEHGREIAALNEMHNDAIAAKDREIAAICEKLAREKAAHEAEILQMKNEHAGIVNMLSAQNKDLASKLEEEQRERRYLKAQYLVLKKETGKLTSEDDHITQLMFDDLQHTFEVFKEFYAAEWKKAKRHIRHDAFKAFRRKNKSNASSEEAQEELLPEKEISKDTEALDLEKPIKLAQENNAAAEAQAIALQEPAVAEEAAVEAQTQENKSEELLPQ